jgi:hypothetical protein
MSTATELECPKCGFPADVLYDGICGSCVSWLEGPSEPTYTDPDDFEYQDFDEGGRCHYCGGDGWGIVGCDWDCDDAINGPYPGEIQRCPCCNGSGNSEDCTFW